MTTVSATEARRKFFDLVKSAAKGHRVYRIQHRSGPAVLMSEEDYDNLVETVELLSIPGFGQSIRRSAKQLKRGETLSLEEVLGEKG